MKIKDILPILDQIAPFESQEEWDNSGLIVGSKEDEFSDIYICLDLDSKVLDSIKENSLVLTHHPLIFKALKRLDFSTYPSNIIKKLIKKDIKLIALHTNADKAFLNEYVAKDVLGFRILDKDEFLIDFEVNMEFFEFYRLIIKKLDLKFIRYQKSNDFIKSATICTGSGGSLIKNVKSDCFLTSDFGYHLGFEARENKISLIDIGHFESERFFSKALAKLLENKGINAIISHLENPFNYTIPT